MKNLESLTHNELREINGGHDGTAYEVGQAAGKIVKYGKYVATIIGFFLS